MILGFCLGAGFTALVIGLFVRYTADDWTDE
jgi:hypothetical protein